MRCDVNLHQSIRCDVKSNQFSQGMASNTRRMRTLLDMLRFRSLWHYRGFVECVINADNLHVLDRLPKYGRIYMHACIHAYMHTCIHTHTYINTYIHACMHACLHTCKHAYTVTHMHAYIHACIHTYTHTRMHADRQTDISK